MWQIKGEGTPARNATVAMTLVCGAESACEPGEEVTLEPAGIDADEVQPRATGTFPLGSLRIQGLERVSESMAESMFVGSLVPYPEEI
jgi:hypothetical protein